MGSSGGEQLEMGTAVSVRFRFCVLIISDQCTQRVSGLEVFPSWKPYNWFLSAYTV